MDDFGHFRMSGRRGKKDGRGRGSKPPARVLHAARQNRARRQVFRSQPGRTTNNSMSGVLFDAEKDSGSISQELYDSTLVTSPENPPSDQTSKGATAQGEQTQMAHQDFDLFACDEGMWGDENEDDFVQYWNLDQLPDNTSYLPQLSMGDLQPLEEDPIIAPLPKKIALQKKAEALATSSASTATSSRSTSNVTFHYPPAPIYVPGNVTSAVTRTTIVPSVRRGPCAQPPSASATREGPPPVSAAVRPSVPPLSAASHLGPPPGQTTTRHGPLVSDQDIRTASARS